MSTIDTLKKQIEAIKTKEAKLKERLRKEERQRRQRKIQAVGSAVLDELEQSPDSDWSRHTRRLIDAAAKTKIDRDILGLPPKESGTVTNGDDGRIIEPDSREEAAPEMKEETRETVNTEKTGTGA